MVNTCVDWKETPEAHVSKVDLPGLNKEEVKVEVEDDKVLKISEERKVEKEEKKDTWHGVEHSSGKFLRGLGFLRMLRWIKSRLQWRMGFSL